MSEVRYNAPSGVLVDDEGTRLGRANEFDFVGAGVTATLVGRKATITIPGGLAGVNINNTIFIDPSYGNDATGVCERLDKPFLTFAAARAAAVAYFVGGDAPSATNRILFWCWSGNMSENIILLNYGDWHFQDTTVTSTTVGLATIDDNGVAVNCIIYGSGILTNGNSEDVINTSGVGTYLVAQIESITNAGDDGIVCGASSSQIITVNSITIEGGIGASCAGIQIIKCNYIVTAGGNAVLCTGSGIQTVHAFYSITTSGDGIATIRCNGGTQTVTSPNATNLSGTNTVLCTGGTQLVRALVAYFVNCTGGTQTVYGDVTDGGASTSGGTQNIYGNVSNAGIGAACSAGTQNIYGNVANTASSAGNLNGCLCSGTGVQNVTGNITSVDTLAYAVRHSSSGSSTYNSPTVSGYLGGAIVSGGTVKFNLSRLVATNATNRSAISITGTTVLILNNCTLIGTGTGFGITSSAAAIVKVYGGCQANLALNTAFAITEQVNTIVIDTNVV